jgi:hypothetical protein
MLHNCLSSQMFEVFFNTSMNILLYSTVYKIKKFTFLGIISGIFQDKSLFHWKNVE